MKPIIWHRIKIDALEFTLEEHSNERYIARFWDTMNELKADSTIEVCETFGGAAQSLIIMIENYYNHG